jgi:probable rRNA maturation factor
MERRRKHKSNSVTQNTCRINIFNSQSALPIDRGSLRKVVIFFLEKKKISCKEISVYLVGEKKMVELHKRFFNDPTPTDCMTFPLDKDFLGELFICPKAALEANHKAPYEEVTLYLFHCLLHLLGYEDTDNKKKARMRYHERRLMNLARESQCILRS